MPLLTIAEWILWVFVVFDGSRSLLGGIHSSIGPYIRLRRAISGSIMLLGALVTLIFPLSKLNLIWIVLVAFIVARAVMWLLMRHAAQLDKRLTEESLRTGTSVEEVIEAEIRR